MFVIWIPQELSDDWEQRVLEKPRPLTLVTTDVMGLPGVDHTR